MRHSIGDTIGETNILTMRYYYIFMPAVLPYRPIWDRGSYWRLSLRVFFNEFNSLPNRPTSKVYASFEIYFTMQTLRGIQQFGYVILNC